MSGILHNARRAGLRQQELYSKRWAPKSPKDRRSSRKHVKKGKHKSC